MDYTLATHRQRCPRSSDEKYPTLLEALIGLCQIVIVLFMIFWATGLGGYLRHNFPEWVRDTNPLSVHRHDKEIEWANLAKRERERADRLGVAYTIHDYFNFLQITEIYRIRYGTSGMSSDYNHLIYKVMPVLCGRPDFNQAELEREQQRVDTWRKKFQAEHNAFVAKAEAAYQAKLPKTPPMPWYGWLWGLLAWLVTTYLKMVVLVAPFYFLMSFSRNNNVRSLISIRRYLLAVLRWPVDLWDYPHSSWRELLAEAELRREGRTSRNLFRRLTHSERDFVREIAADRDSFLLWQQRPRNAPQWSLATAVLAVLLLLPAKVMASDVDVGNESGASISTTTVTSPVLLCASDADPPREYEYACIGLPVIVPEMVAVEPSPPSAHGLFFDPERRIRPGPIRDILHVPLLPQTLVV